MSHRIEETALSAAPPSAVFALLADGSTWPQWGAFDSFALEELAPGPVAEGVGALRVLTSHSYGRRVVSRERITLLEPDRALGYELVSGLPLRGYTARVDCEPQEGGGTVIRWRSTFDGAAVPGTAGFYRKALAGFIARTAAALARAAERATSPSARQ